MAGSSPERRKISMLGMGLELGGAVAGFTFLGVWLDRYYGTEPKALLICAAIGIVGGLYNFVRGARRASERANRESAASRSKTADSK